MALETSGNPKFETRLPQEVHADLGTMAAAGIPAREILSAVADTWKRAGRPADLLARVRTLADAGQTESAQRNETERLRQRARELTLREKELAAREQETAHLLADAKARVLRAQNETAAVEAGSRLRRQVIDAGEALLRQGAKPQDVAAVFRAIAAASLAPEAVAHEIERLGGLNKAVAAWSEHVRKLQSETARLQGEVAALQEERAKLLGAVRDAVRDAAGEVRQGLAGIDAAAGRIDRAATRAETKMEQAGRQVAEYLLRLSDADALARETLASLIETVGPVALAAQLLALHIERAGDTELPRELGEDRPYAPRLSWATDKLRKLAAQVAPNVLAVPEQGSPEGGASA